MYTYKNKVTGAIVTTYGKVTGANWEQVKDTKTKANTQDGKEPDGE